MRMTLATVTISCLLLQIFSSSPIVKAASPPVSEAVRKDSQADPEVIKNKIDDLKQAVVNKKTQMLLFKQFLKSEGVESGLPLVTITHSNEMGTRYQIFSLTYSIDKEKVYTFYLEDSLGRQKLPDEISIFKGPLIPGTHDLSIEIVY